MDYYKYCYTKAKIDLLEWKIKLKIKKPNEWSVKKDSLKDLQQELNKLKRSVKWANYKI